MPEGHTSARQPKAELLTTGGPSRIGRRNSGNSALTVPMAGSQMNEEKPLKFSYHENYGKIPVGFKGMFIT